MQRIKWQYTQIVKGNMASIAEQMSNLNIKMQIIKK
jgi:hypothetical protein